MPAFSVVNSEVLLRAQCETFLCAPAVLLKKETIADCMADDALRAYFGRTLKDELLPGRRRDGREEAVILTCRALETRAISPTSDSLTDGLIGRFQTHLLPALTGRARGLCFSLACATMLFCGAKRVGDGYEIIGSQGDKRVLLTEPEALYAFSRLSPDMPADSLAYAVLSDDALWGRDLRGIEGLADTLEDTLRDLQILGLARALERL